MSRRFRPLFAIILAASFTACATTRAEQPLAPSGDLVVCPGGSIEAPEHLATFAGCNVVAGSLAVRGTTLFDLDALSKLSAVERTLVIADNPNLEDLRGLERLGAVGKLEIRNNRKLASLSDLSSLVVADEVRLAENPRLRTLAGLGGLERVERLEIRENGLYDANGLEGLRDVGELVIERNGTLISLAGLANVRRADSVQIHENPRLCGCFGLLPRLERVERGLSATKNWGLSKSDVHALRERARRGLPAPPGDSEFALSKQ